MVALSLSFQSSALLLIDLVSLGIVLLLMFPLSGMLFQMRFVPLAPWPLSERSLKPTCTPKHTHLSLNHPLAFSVVLDPFFCLWILKFCRLFLCQLTRQSADIMSSLCGVGVRVRVNNFFSKTTRPRDMLFF